MIIGPAYDTATSGTGTVFAKQVMVTQASDLSGTLDSTVAYFIDGFVDMGTTSIEVPSEGLTLLAYGFEVSKLFSTATTYTMFTSPVGGSGTLHGEGYAVEVTGVGSKVYDLVGDTGSELFEMERVRYLNCVSLGIVKGYQQGLELGTNRIGGKPSLTLDGAWSGGYRVTTTIMRGVDNTMADAVFKAGATFVMQSRFLSDANFDLGTLAPLADFIPANFPNQSTLQLNGAVIARNGVIDPTDTTILPNMTASMLSSAFQDNIGLDNTFVGGNNEITTAVATDLSTAGINVYADLAGTFTAADLQHFDTPANGQLRHIGTSPRAYKVSASIVVTVQLMTR